MTSVGRKLWHNALQAIAGPESSALGINANPLGRIEIDSKWCIVASLQRERRRGHVWGWNGRGRNRWSRCRPRGGATRESPAGKIGEFFLSATHRSQSQPDKYSGPSLSHPAAFESCFPLTFSVGRPSRMALARNHSVCSPRWNFPTDNPLARGRDDYRAGAVDKNSGWRETHSQNVGRLTRQYLAEMAPLMLPTDVSAHSSPLEE